MGCEIITDTYGSYQGGLSFEFDYNNDGQQTSFTNPKGADRLKTYDEEGRLLCEYGAKGDQGDMLDKRMVKQYDYYENGSIKKIIEGTALDSDKGTIEEERSVSFKYDPYTGAVIEKKYSDGKTETYYYNEYTSLLERIEITQGETLVYWKTFSYDPANWRVSSVSTPEGTINYEYNNYGGLSRITSSSGQDVSYLYDEMGRLLNVISRDFSSSGDEVKKFTYEYSTTGRLEKKTSPNGTEVNYTYDDRGNIATITHKKEADQLLRLEYTRDNRGIITQLLEKRKNKSDVTWNYTYDYQKRLTNATRAVSGGSTTTYSYSYDNASNRTQKVVDGDTTTTYTYTYNSLDQLIQEDSTDTSEVKTYVYDEFGNLKYEKTDGVAKREYFWDSKNSLTKAIITDTVTITVYYGYDEQGTRISKKVDSDPETKYLTDYKNPTGYSQVLSEYNASDPEDFTNYYYGDQLLAQNDSTNGLSYFHTDHLYSNRLLTDSSGSIINNSDFNYSPYGIPLNGDSSLTNYRFTGQYRDATLGYQYHRARWLSCSRSSWLSFDPVFDFPGNFGNGYGYCISNSVNFYDLSGFIPIGTTFGLILVAFLIAIFAIPYISGKGYSWSRKSKNIFQTIFRRRSELINSQHEKEAEAELEYLIGYFQSYSRKRFDEGWTYGKLGNLKVSIVNGVCEFVNDVDIRDPNEAYIRKRGCCTDWQQNTLDSLNEAKNKRPIKYWEWSKIVGYKYEKLLFGVYQHNAVAIFRRPKDCTKHKDQWEGPSSKILDPWIEGLQDDNCVKVYDTDEWIGTWNPTRYPFLIENIYNMGVEIE